jgi:hypothetical protein
MLERLAEERVRESMMEYKLRQSLQGAASGPTNRQRLAALLENGRKVGICIYSVDRTREGITLPLC